MIGYVTLGTSDIRRAAKFYDALAGVLGATRMMGDETQDFIAWTIPGSESAGIGVMKPFDGNPCSVGNGVMVALQAKDPDQVKLLYDTAMANGANDEGAPGPRGDDGFYAGYFRDLDGNKLNAFCMVAPA